MSYEKSTTFTGRARRSLCLTKNPPLCVSRACDRHQIDMVAALKSFDQPALSASAHRLPYAFDLPIQLSCRLSRLPALLPLPVFLRPVSEIVASIS